MIIENEKLILLGDLHFGKNKFSKVTLESQLRFFDGQLFPYMLKNNIKHIIQAGDVFDNRITMDIEYFQMLQDLFFDKMKQYGFTFTCVVGNHDIYHRSSRDFTLLNTIGKLYSNVNIINTRQEWSINNNRFYFVPWILPTETLSGDELTGMNYVLGHFEIQNFEMSKGHLDDHSILSPEFFKKKKSLKKVYSGHYHIKAEKEKIEYLGTPYWLDWGDYGTTRGFYVLDEDMKETYIENNQSTRYVKLKYSDKNEKPLKIDGLDAISHDVDLEDISQYIQFLKNHKLKLFINDSSDNKHEEYIYTLKQFGLDFEITNNVEISNIIGESYISPIEEVDDKGEPIKIPSSGKGLILDTVKKKSPSLIPIVEELFRELEEVQ